MTGFITLDEGLGVLEKAIVKANLVFDGYALNTLFTADEYITFYSCVYSMCFEHIPQVPHGYSMQLYERFKRAMEESIFSKVLPSIEDKNGAPLLLELLRMWERYKLMAKCLRGFFLYLDRYFTRVQNVASLDDVSFNCFRNLVCNEFYQRFQDAAILLIIQDRAGELIDRDLLKNILNFFVEIGCGNSYYYHSFEKAMLLEAAYFYYRLASEWLSGYLYTDYMLKVDWCLNQEKGRASQYLHQATVERLLQVVQQQLLGQTASKLIEKQKAEHHDAATYQELLSRCASLNLGDGSSASLS